MPDEYLRLLSYELPEGRELGFRFTKTGTQEEWEGQVTEFIRYEQSTVESALVADPADLRCKHLPIATDSGGNCLYLDVTKNPMCVVDVSYESGAKSRVAGSMSTSSTCSIRSMNAVVKSQRHLRLPRRRVDPLQRVAVANALHNEGSPQPDGSQMRPTPFFATRDDLMNWLRSVSAGRSLVLTEAGMFDAPEVKTCRWKDCERLGISRTGNHLTDVMYLVHDQSVRIEVREVPQRRGGVRYSIDQRLNPQTVGLRPGGTFGGNIIISGQLGHGTGHPWSDDLAHVLRKELRKQFTRIKSYYVGEGALARLDSGTRLTINAAAAEEYDLVRQTASGS